MDHVSIFDFYIDNLRKDFETGAATEHTYRPALKQLFESLAPETIAVNEPKRQKLGAPDFQIEHRDEHMLSQAKLFSSPPLAFVEHKDLTENLDKPEHQDQLNRYLRLGNVLHTNGLLFRFYIKDQKPVEIQLAELTADKQIVADSARYSELALAYKELLRADSITVRTPLKLATMMAERAQAIRDIIENALKQDIEDGEQSDLANQYKVFQRQLIHDLSVKQFADLYAQTLAYGLFAARYSDESLETFTLSEAGKKLPQANQFLRKFFHEIAAYEHDVRINWVLDNLVDVFRRVDVKKLMFGAGEEWARHHDPIIHFYETFLGLYDAKTRKSMGVYYTPKPVVKYIVRAVDELLKSDFGISEGLASTEMTKTTIKTQPQNKRDDKKGYSEVEKDVHKVQILDPALGTGTFLNEVIRYVAEQVKPRVGSGWSGYVEQHLLHRLYGFELMMAPYAMAHLRLNITLSELGYKPVRGSKLNVFLTNALEAPETDELNQLQFIGFQQILATESQEADLVKKRHNVMVVLGNPPYSVSSNNKSKYIEDLLRDYKKDLNERNIQPLSDDYIKFIRFASHMIEKNGEGIMAMITNNSYVDGLIHRQMRKHLMQVFDKVYVLDLHGNSKKKETAPDGSKDENVFDIQQGVAILIGVKTGYPREVSDKLAKVYKSDLYGRRLAKFKALETGNFFNNDTLLEVDSLRSMFITSDIELKKEYDSYVSIRDLMPFGDAGIKTHRDAFVTDFDKKVLLDRIARFVHGEDDFGLKDTRDFSISEARYKLRHVNLEDLIITEAYRPFDNRFLVYDVAVADWPRQRTMRQIIGKKNLVLAVCRQQSTYDFQHIFVTYLPIDMCYVSLQTKETGYAIPLYLYSDLGKEKNFDDLQLEQLLKNTHNNYSPEDVFDYIYARLHSPSYRSKYKEFLKADFPRIPPPKNDDEFVIVKNLGTQLRKVHLMEDAELAHKYYTPTDDIPSDWTVEKPLYMPVTDTHGKVYVNSHQYFANVPKIAWEFYIGGYQPAQKWLKDRKGRKLSTDDLLHYQKIIASLEKTYNLMQQIDKIWQP